MDSVAYPLRSATVPQVVEQYSFQFYLFSLIASVPFAIILKIFFLSLGNSTVQKSLSITKSSSIGILMQKCVLVLE